MIAECLLHCPSSNRVQNLSKNYRYGWSRGTSRVTLPVTPLRYTQDNIRNHNDKKYTSWLGWWHNYDKNHRQSRCGSLILFLGPKIHAKTVFDKGYDPKLHESYLTEKTCEISENFAEIASVQFIGRRDMS